MTIIISEYPLGQLPIMKVNGEVFCQEAAIHEFAAKRCRMGGKTPIEELQLDMFRGTLYEVFFIGIQIEYFFLKIFELSYKKIV